MFDTERINVSLSKQVEQEKKKTEKEILKPVNVFLLSQKINFLPNQDISGIELAIRPAEPRSKILPAKLTDKSLVSNPIHLQSVDVIY